jgi:hypothetical protein
MKINLFAIIIALSMFITGCDITYSCYIHNDSRNEIKIKICPPIEYEELAWQPSIQFVSYDTCQHDSCAIYAITPKSKVRFFGYLGAVPTERFLPTYFLELYSSDTLTLIGKESIIEHLIEFDKRKFAITINN